MDIRYNQDLDTFEKVEIVPADAVAQQISAWQRDIDFHNGEIQRLSTQISSMSGLVEERVSAIQAKGIEIK